MADDDKKAKEAPKATEKKVEPTPAPAPKKEAPKAAPKKKLYETSFYVESYCRSKGLAPNKSAGFVLFCQQHDPGPYTATVWAGKWEAFMNRRVK